MEKLKNLFELKDRKWSPDGPSFQTYLTILKLVPGNFWDWVRTKNKFRFWEDFWNSSCAISDFRKSFFNALAIFLTTYQSQSKYSRIDLQKKFFFLKKKTFWLLFIDSTVSRLQSNYEEKVYSLPLSPQEYLALNFIHLSRMKGWVTLGATEWFWTWDPWFGIQGLNH